MNTMIKTMVTMALEEDIDSGDITAALIPQHQASTATVITRENMILCGRDWVDEVFRQIDATLAVVWLVNEGEHASPNQVLFTVQGCSRSILTAERSALNFLQLLSGTATSTNAYVQVLKGTQTQLLDTRKTLPLYRQAQKYAVRCGGGKNHRMGLYDAFLIKENHIAACGSITLAIQTARQQYPDKWVEVEVENLVEYEEAIRAKSDVIMLDNFSFEDIKKAVASRTNGIKLEISGNVTLDTIRDYALLGIDFISVGAITKHVRAIDLSMRVL